MKKLLFLFITFTLSFGYSSAQNYNQEFAPIGAQWWEDGPSREYKSLYYYRATGDSLYHGHIARVIRQKKYHIYYNWNSPGNPRNSVIGVKDSTLFGIANQV